MDRATAERHAETVTLVLSEHKGGALLDEIHDAMLAVLRTLP